MADDDDRTTSTQHSPAHGPGAHAESREETIDRVLDEQERVLASEDEQSGIVDPGRDPSSRRGLNRRTLRGAAIGFAVGAVIGLLVALLFELQPEPLDTGRPIYQAMWLSFMAIAIGVPGAIIGAYMALEREDGRVEQDVERTIGD